MNSGDRVSLQDAQATHYGTITMADYPNGMCFVKWDSGITEKIHMSELTFVEGGAPFDQEKELDEGYEPDDPKHSSFLGRLSTLWDSRPGK